MHLLVFLATEGEQLSDAGHNFLSNRVGMLDFFGICFLAGAPEDSFWFLSKDLML